MVVVVVVIIVMVISNIILPLMITVKKKEMEKYRMRGSNSRPLACEASVIATTPTRLLFSFPGMVIRRNRLTHSFTQI